MTMNNEPIEKNRKPAVSDKSKTDVTRSGLAKIHISSELLRTSNRISELFYARKIPVLQEALKPLQGQYATYFGEALKLLQGQYATYFGEALKPLQGQYSTHFEEALKPFREQNAARCRELLEVVQGQNPFIDSIHFEIPVFNDQFSASLELIGEAIENLLGSVNKTIPLEAFNLFKDAPKKFPENLMGVGNSLTIEQAFKMAKRDGIPLYCVPGKSVILELVEAGSRVSRRKILVKYQKSIFEDCKTVLNKISSEYALEKKFFILAGLNALENGHVEAAQALFTNTLDTVHQNFWGLDRQSRTAISNHAEGDELPQLIKNMDFLDIFVFAPIWNSHMKFFGHAGEEPPTEYSRHASVHGVSRRQYKLENCIQALMLVTSLLIYVEENGKILIHDSES